jgi:ATP-dependent Clp protease protease subunit
MKDDVGFDSGAANGVASSIVNTSGGSGGLERFIVEGMLLTRTIQLFGTVDQQMAQKVIGQLLILEADDPQKPITIVQNSPGGSVNDGFAIYDAMCFVKPTIHVLCVGLTASIATVTLLGASKEHRYSLPNTRFLIHQPLIPGTVFGPASDLEITAQEILKTRDKINKLLSDETGQPLAQVAKDAQRDYWMDAERALEYGLVSKIVKSRNELE